MNKRKYFPMLAACVCSLCLRPLQVLAAETETYRLIQLYQEYEERFAAIETTADIEAQGYTRFEEQCFAVELESFGGREVNFIPIMDDTYHRMAVLIADGRGDVLYKTDQLEANYKWLGKLEQPNTGIASVSFQDLDGNGMKDIVLIVTCENDSGDYMGRPYKVGDVLFGREGGFYRDWRISDKINRFSMNKSIRFITAYVRDGNSTEILYTASTLDELLEKGFQIFEEQSYYREFEKQGRLLVAPGYLRMGDYSVFMIYLVNEQGNIVWSFQPMGDYDNIYALKGMACKDLDGDGMKDILVLAAYSYEGPEEQLMVDTKCRIYYQRADGFEEDTEFEEAYLCTDKDKVSELVDRVRAYWGWTKEE